MTQTTLQTRFRRSLSGLIGWFFGTLWASVGAFALPAPYDRVGFALAAMPALLFLVRLWRNQPRTAVARPLFSASAYLIAVAAEVLAIYAASRLLVRFGAPQQIFPAVGCIVGLHFIGLWIATRSPRFLRITAGMCCVSVLSMAMPFTWHGVGVRYLMLGAGNAIVLWLASSGAD